MLVWYVLWCYEQPWLVELCAKKKEKNLWFRPCVFSKLCLHGSGANWCVWHSLCSEICAASAAGWGFALSPLRSGVTTAKLESNKGHLSLPWKYIWFLFLSCGSGSNCYLNLTCSFSVLFIKCVITACNFKRSKNCFNFKINRIWLASVWLLARKWTILKIGTRMNV